MPLPPTKVENNAIQWKNYAWPKDGEEWSVLWGGSRNQWKHFVLPRIRQFLPAETILEIGPGHGRWTQFLVDCCQQLIVVDLTPECIDYCKKRFSKRTNITYLKNDGRSLNMIKDGSIDLVFSFDAMIHADAETIENYVRQFPAKMKPDAGAFIHHSNAGAYRKLREAAAWLAGHSNPRIAKYIKSRVFGGWRGNDMSASAMAEFCRDAGMSCVSKEIFAAGRLIVPADCVSTLRNTATDVLPVPEKIDYRGMAVASMRAAEDEQECETGATEPCYENQKLAAGS